VDVLYLLITLSVVLVAVIAGALLWAVRSGQFEDLEGPAHRVLMDDDEHPPPARPGPAGKAADRRRDA
jgi:cbb3-type cytochrome oxidase maturation protein